MKKMLRNLAFTGVIGLAGAVSFGCDERKFPYTLIEDISKGCVSITTFDDRNYDGKEDTSYNSAYCDGQLMSWSYRDFELGENTTIVNKQR